MADASRLILASGSSARRTMLDAAGLTFDVVPADIDEAGIRAAMMGESDCVEASDIAAMLAAEKAVAVARANPDALVIGSDQVLALGRRFFEKATTMTEARETLDCLRGRTHELVSAVALAHGNDILWHTLESAQMTMRPFSDEFLGSYLTRTGDRVLRAVGCYELEGAGVQLFERIDGDYFTILGMPLLPLLEELRRRTLVMT